MLWIKSFHIMFVIAWFAGLLYLPRLFVYHCDTTDQAGLARFKTMERRLFSIMTVGGVGALVFGLWLLAGYGLHAYAGAGWLHVKLLLVLGLILFHLYCAVLMRAFRKDANRHSARYFRIINEVPALAMVAIVILAVVKPF